MAVYEESALRVDLPDGSHFRFADLATYRGLSGQNLKEMDYAWLESGDGSGLVLLEIRSYAQVTETLTTRDFAKGARRFEALVDKVTDSLLMLGAAWAATRTGHDLSKELPEAARAPCPLRVILAVELPSALATHLGPLRDALNHRLRGRLQLFDVRAAALLDYARLQALFPTMVAPISKPETT
jgi:hypothetical protein